MSINRKQIGIMSIVAISAIYIAMGTGDVESKPESVIRFGQFNIWEMSTTKITEIDKNGAGSNKQLRAAAVIIRELRPDILILNEIDHDYTGGTDDPDLALNARRFNDLYLNIGAYPIDYPYAYAAPCNTGFLTGKDLDNDGVTATEQHLGMREHGSDSYGFGVYPGQYSMALLSKYPIMVDQARLFQKFRWIDMPDNIIPPGWFTDDELEIYRLSSKSHWDIPVQIGDKLVHLLISHPTPPIFDGPEDLNGRRNFDELKMWVHYIDNDSVMVDDAGVRGGLPQHESFIIAGDLNAAKYGDKLATGQRSIDQLLAHERVIPTGKYLTSEGALNGRAPGPPEYIERRTTGKDDRGLRIDYILPSKDLTPLRGGVYWPDAEKDPDGAARVQLASDHRMTWLDIRLD